jgi:hypothetical protein
MEERRERRTVGGRPGEGYARFSLPRRTRDNEGVEAAWSAERVQVRDEGGWYEAAGAVWLS